MKQHPREKIVRKARLDFLEVFGPWLARNDELTSIETAQILTQEIQTTLKYALRVERHGRDDKPSGLA